MTTVQTLLNDPDTAGVWNLVPERSALQFITRSVWGLIRVKGHFTQVSGDAQITGKGAVFGRLDIQTASLRTGIRKRDAHLRSADFFDVERFPQVSVVVTAVQPTTANSAELQTSVSVKDTTTSLLLPVVIVSTDDGAVRISTKTTLDRDEFGLGWNRLGMAGKTTTVIAEAVFVRAP